AIDNPELASAFFTQVDGSTIKSVINNNVFSKSSDGLFYKNGESQCVDRLKLSGDGVVYYELDSGKGKSIPGSDIGLGDLGGCKVLRINFQEPSSSDDAQKLSKQTVAVAGLSATGGGGSGGGGGSNSGDTAGTDDGTCELNSSGFSLAWVMCPILAAATDFSNKLTSKFEGQLSFSVSQDIRSDNGGQTKVRTTWLLVKNLATAFLVIIMLVMVISQAIGSGPFDAYTMRKILPRLVVAVIVMQLSWPLFAWVVDVFDHAGKGLGELMYAPFGGPDQLKLGGLLANAKISTLEAAGINYALLIPLIGLGMASLPMLLAAAVTASMAILVALITLIFRKILIIMALILAPLALLAWILPGTQKYWKLWQDNFIKLLAMYPLVVAIIAAGRIFAYVVGTQGNGLFLNFLLVLVGFFGPLFILPRTFKWGGGIMSMVGNTVSSTFKPGTDKMAAGARGIGERWQGRRAKMYDPNDANFKLQKNRFGVPMLGGKVLRRVQSGHVVPFSKRSQRLAIQAGDKWSNDEDEMAQALIKRKGEKVMREGYEADVKKKKKKKRPRSLIKTAQ
ncbi:hypothetical protein KW789_02905, partial [Candidatus Saccharibacteria bacterium]|nr:hypothetical protein [Candidatus Saccharibacteria bacterium]